jgi:hypothetical protein
MRSKWVDLMMHRGALACAEMTYSRNTSNFRAMCRARVMYEAAITTFGAMRLLRAERLRSLRVRGFATCSGPVGRLSIHRQSGLQYRSRPGECLCRARSHPVLDERHKANTLAHRLIVALAVLASPTAQAQQSALTLAC